MSTFLSPYFIIFSKFSSIQDQIPLSFSTHAVIQSLHLANMKEQAPKCPFSHLSSNRGTGISSIQSNPVKAAFTFTSITSEFEYLTSKGLLIEVKVPLPHGAGGTNQAEMVEAWSE